MLIYLSTAAPQKPVFAQEANYVAQRVFASQFSKLQTNSVFPLAAALDPRVKFSYWKPPLYSKEDTDRFIAIVRSFWDRNAGQDAGPTGKSTFDTIFELEPIEKPNDLDRYISESPSTSGFTEANVALQYWKANSSNFVALSKLARRFLAVPVSSLPWESIFSQGKPSLAPGTTIDSTLLQKWKQFLA